MSSGKYRKLGAKQALRKHQETPSIKLKTIELSAEEVGVRFVVSAI
jgi:hypothetical protein